MVRYVSTWQSHQSCPLVVPARSTSDKHATPDSTTDQNQSSELPPSVVSEQFRRALVELWLPGWIRHRKIFNTRVHLDWGTRVRAVCSMGTRNHGDSHLTRWRPTQGAQTDPKLQVRTAWGIRCMLRVADVEPITCRKLQTTMHAGNFGTQITLPFRRRPEITHVRSSYQMAGYGR
jgi:hypothetical protein